MHGIYGTCSQSEIIQYDLDFIKYSQKQNITFAWTTEKMTNVVNQMRFLKSPTHLPPHIEIPRSVDCMAPSGDMLT